MKKIIIVLIAMLFLVTGCQKQEEKSVDFWMAIVDATKDQLEDNWYQNDDFSIAVEDLENAKDADHPSLTIRKEIKEEETTKNIMFSLQNEDEKSLEYIYEITESDGKSQTLRIKAENENYNEYTLDYEDYDAKANGKLSIGKDNQITYDNVPLLKETLLMSLQLLNEVQAEFDINLQDYNFVNLPQLTNDLEIPPLNQVSQETSLTIDYYSSPHANARGYMLSDYVKVSKDFATIEFGVYNLDREDYDLKNEATLKQRSLDNCYDIVQKGDPDVNYAIYFDDNKAYMYDQTTSDSDIENDVKNNDALQAQIILQIPNE